MKRIINSLVLLFLLTIKAYSQDTDRFIELRTENDKPTDAVFYIVLGKDTLWSVKGKLTINAERYNKYKDSELKIQFSKKEKEIFAKLYKEPSIAKVDTSLKKICETPIKLERKY